MLKWILTFVFVFLWSGGYLANAQKEDLNARDPRLNEGQMFTVKLVPAGKTVQVFVAGKEMAKVDLREMDLRASILAGKTWTAVSPAREEDHFNITLPEQQASELKLKVKYKGQAEEFKMPLNSPKR